MKALPKERGQVADITRVADPHERRLQIIDLETDVVDPFPSRLDEPPDGGPLGDRLHELDPGPAGRQERDAHPVAFHLLDAA